MYKIVKIQNDSHEKEICTSPSAESLCHILDRVARIYKMSFVSDASISIFCGYWNHPKDNSRWLVKS